MMDWIQIYRRHFLGIYKKMIKMLLGKMQRKSQDLFQLNVLITFLKKKYFEAIEGLILKWLCAVIRGMWYRDVEI